MEYQQHQAMPGYWNESILKPRPFYYTDFDKSIEKIVLDEPEEPKGLAERVFSDKSKTLKSTIKALFNEINIRERLDSFLLYRIDEDICKSRTYLHELKFLNQPYTLNPDLTNRRTKLENQIFQLEQEKRKAYLECWKDLMGLKKELLSALKDYWLISKRRDVFTYNLNKFAEEDEDD
jgi:hypothetical protein